MSKITIFAHRGASGYELENTLAAFSKALELKVEAVELDVHRCKSGEIVVNHDYKINRTTNGKGKIKKLPLADIRRYETHNGETIPTLKEILNLIDGKMCINIELKGKNTARNTAEIIRQAVRRGPWQYDQFIISSFHYGEIKHFHDILPEIRIGLLYTGKPKKLEKRVMRNHAYSVHLNCRTIKKAWIHEAHDYNIKVFVWTVDDQITAKHLKSLGVDGFFSNYPDRLIKK